MVYRTREQIDARLGEGGLLHNLRRAWPAVVTIMGLAGAAASLFSLYERKMMGDDSWVWTDGLPMLLGALCFGVLIAAAYLAKDAVILLFFVIPMKIRNAAVLLIVIETFNLLRDAANAGGNAAHLGGLVFAQRHG